MIGMLNGAHFAIVDRHHYLDKQDLVKISGKDKLLETPLNSGQ